MVRQDILNGEGVCLIDPHGHLFENIVQWCETAGIQDWRNVLVLDPSVDGIAFGFNPLDFTRYLDTTTQLTRDFCIDAVITAIAQAWRENDPSRTPQLRRCLYCLLYPLIENELTLLEYRDILLQTDEGKAVRKYIAQRTGDEYIEAEWESFNVRAGGSFEDVWGSTRNRLFEFIKTPIIRNIVGQQGRTIDFYKLMNERWVVLVNLSGGGGKLSPDNARLLGALLVNDMFLAARARSEKEGREKPFHCYIDECAQFLNREVGTVLTEGRKFGLHLCLAHQDISQLRDEGEVVRKAVLGSARTKIVFGGLIPEDAEEIASLIYDAELNLEEPKRLFDKPTVARYVRSYFERYGHSASTTETTTSGRTESQGETHYDDGSTGDSRQVVESWHDSSGSAQSEGEQWGWQEGLEPALEWLPTQGYTLEEQVHKAVALIRGQPQRHAIVKAKERRSARFRVPAIRDGVANDERCKRFKHETSMLGRFASAVEDVERARAERKTVLLEKAQAFLQRGPEGQEVPEGDDTLDFWGEYEPKNLVK